MDLFLWYVIESRGGAKSVKEEKTKEAKGVRKTKRCITRRKKI